MITSRTKHSILTTLRARLTKNINRAVDAIIDNIDNPHTSDRLSQYVYLLDESLKAVETLGIQYKILLQAEKYPAKRDNHVRELTAAVSTQLDLMAQEIKNNYPDSDQDMISFLGRITESANNNNASDIMHHYEMIIQPIMHNVNTLHFSTGKTTPYKNDEARIVDFNNKLEFLTQEIKPHLDILQKLLIKRRNWTMTKEHENSILSHIPILESFIADLKKIHFRNALLEARRRYTPGDVINTFLLRINQIDSKLANELGAFIVPLYHVPNSSPSNEDDLEATVEKSPSDTSAAKPYRTSIIMQQVGASTISSKDTTSQKAPIYLSEQLQHNRPTSPACKMFQSEQHSSSETQKKTVEAPTLPAILYK